MKTNTDFAWLIEHNHEWFGQYPGKWLAIWQEQIIAIGDTALEAAQQAELRAPGEDYLLHAIERETDVIYAGLSLG